MSRTVPCLNATPLQAIPSIASPRLDCLDWVLLVGGRGSYSAYPRLLALPPRGPSERMAGSYVGYSVKPFAGEYRFVPTCRTLRDAPANSSVLTPARGPQNPRQAAKRPKHKGTPLRRTSQAPKQINLWVAPGMSACADIEGQLPLFAPPESQLESRMLSDNFKPHTPPVPLRVCQEFVSSNVAI